MRQEPRRRLSLLLGIIIAGATLSACGQPSKEDLIRKSEAARTKAELEKALGRPDDIAKLGPLEHWTYRAKNGEVIFVIAGDTVALQATGNSSRQK